MEFSIITVNLNNIEGLRKTIKSVVYQSFKQYEHIIIDGGSTDGSINIIKEYNDNITYWVSEPDSGIYCAMNKGIRKAKGKYCLFLNSGDRFFNEDVLKEVFSLNLVEDIVYGDEVVEENGINTISKFLLPDHITFNSFLHSTLPHQCSFIRRELFNLIGLYNERNKIVSDWEWNTLALFRFNCSLRKINLPISFYDTNGISADERLMEEHIQEKRQSLIKNFPRIITDSDDYYHLLKRYKKIPRIISGVYNKIVK
jgi:glycosyltransferase involved in cell wall biosynthesis